MDSKIFEEKLKEMEAEIKHVSDNDLNVMGMETAEMIETLKKDLGEKHEFTIGAGRLMAILHKEYDRRTSLPEEKEEAVFVPSPNTFNELMCLGSGDIVEPEFANK